MLAAKQVRLVARDEVGKVGRVDTNAPMSLEQVDSHVAALVSCDLLARIGRARVCVCVCAGEERERF